MVIDDVARIRLGETSGCRLVNSHYPPIALFDDVADASEFDALFALQALTNPRLRDGKDIHYLEQNVVKVIWPLSKVALIEVLQSEEEENLIGFVRE